MYIYLFIYKLQSKNLYLYIHIALSLITKLRLPAIIVAMMSAASNNIAFEPIYYIYICRYICISTYIHKGESAVYRYLC